MTNINLNSPEAQQSLPLQLTGPLDRTIFDREVAYMFGFIKRICTEIGPGIPCSPQERQRALVIKEEMQATLGADNVEVEQTVLAPKAFLGWYRWGCAASLVSAAFFFTRHISGFPLIWSALSFLLVLAVSITTVFEFFLAREFIDRFFRKAESQNVIGHIRRKEESAEPIQRLLIISGHHDSAIQYNWLTYTGFGYYIAQLFAVVPLALILFGTGTEFFSILLFDKSFDWVQQFMFWVNVTIGPLGLISAFFFLGPQREGGTVPGAVDNLSACAITLAVGRVLTLYPGLIPPHTEVRLITFGSEEASLRGSSRYVERHIDELRRLDARVCNLESIIDPEITIFTSDGNGFTRNIPAACSALAQAARAANVPYALRPFPMFGGGTDALPFSRSKIKAATLFAMRVPEQMVRWYHTPRDTYTLFLNEKEGGTRGLYNALKICVEWVKREGDTQGTPK